MMNENLDASQIELLHDYMQLPEDKQRFIQYIMRVGASQIFSDEEFADFLGMLER